MVSMPASPYPSYADAPPKLVGGALALDFVNTVEWRGDPDAAGERLTSYRELALWAARSGAVPADQAAALLAESAARPADSATWLDRAIRLREGIARLVDPDAGSADDDLTLLNRMLALAAGPARLQRTSAGIAWADDPADPLATPLTAVARDAAELLVSGRAGRVRCCDDRRCGWLFIDPARGRGRRWCSMADCGNRAKARRHYRRRTAGSPR